MRKEAMLWEKCEGDEIHCYLCAHHCIVPESGFGFCAVRQNIKGCLYTYTYGRAIADTVDPIEKKPFYHFLPGTYAYSIATAGCNFRCSFCQNWTISQLSVMGGKIEGYELLPEKIARNALEKSCRSISCTYTEPTIFFEYAYDVCRIAKDNGLYNTFVTNGFMTKKAIDVMAGYIDAANVDLKFFQNSSYEKICKGRLQPVLDSIQYMKDKGIWIEITTLVVPGVNDSDKELKDIAGFIAKIDKSIPWHISRFHPDYKDMELLPTSMLLLNRAFEIGKAAGLEYVYLGNVAQKTGTLCPGCGELLIKRAGFNAVCQPNFLKSGRCGSCGKSISGIWS
ncbi:MAG: AmmeMemoRadiSam system radical SAM enzyme [Candidatus Omnitrophica bacterium]|nr:AmmeMemoRadiSam system radical SAM enzyme [Candidatus Omnitrophota bacterium]MBU1894416.1 AmmeMemoRadiSam system radical SAM enzyme [Candidatus Omnitrophota bacterium]